MSAIINNIANKTVYWSKVGLEVAKIVYKKEFQPPTTEQFKTVYNSAFKFIQTPTLQKQFIKDVAQIQPTKENAFKYGFYGIQLLAFFSIGEAIGRRNLTGYPTPEGEHH
ncbi:ATP synthase subunit g, mitochondrial [[Candida] jaroonii]|uniref:ATP synthase subunit g, mitochondrial n=1 Tax=[Candida] jaroonii TaxID=467808 RepID=A0ACA9YC38_9ASCO|nr:ATP synthase subunit g, mitochondrial [[Candida] jaroonii]